MDQKMNRQIENSLDELIDKLKELEDKLPSRDEVKIIDRIHYILKFLMLITTLVVIWGIIKALILGDVL